MNPVAQQCPGFCPCYDAHPDLAKKHITQHRNFSRKVVAMRDKLRVGQDVSRMEVLKFLNDWLHKHLLNIDQQYGEFIQRPKNEFDCVSSK